LRTTINTLEEKERLAKFLMERLEALKKKELETGEMVPETRETVTALTTVLDKIRLESSGIEETPDQLRERLFGDWMRKRKKERQEEEDGV